MVSDCPNTVVSLHRMPGCILLWAISMLPSYSTMLLVHVQLSESLTCMLSPITWFGRDPLSSGFSGKRIASLAILFHTLKVACRGCRAYAAPDVLSQHGAMNAALKS